MIMQDTRLDIEATLIFNSGHERVSPRLSVLIPFFRESPAELMKALNAIAADVRDEIEVVVLDDGSRRPELSLEVMDLLDTLNIAICFIELKHNVGRAKGRNRLVDAARGAYVLFLDADMLPDQDNFLERWVDMTRAEAPVVFGGFSLLKAPKSKAYALHAQMAGHSDCLSAAERLKSPEKYVFTSNLLVRKDVFKTHDFDPEFKGWGWEDVEWAMRVSADFGIDHIDNTATHMGLDTADVLLSKYEQSGANFARVVRKHPEIVTRYPSYKMARLIKALPFGNLLRGVLKSTVQSQSLPLKARAFALRLYRAAIYADAL